MENKFIRLRGTRTHNLKDINIDIPRNQLVVITGLSGSGKSSLAFDTIYAEGQRRYVESLSSYARQFLSMMEKPDIDSIEGLSPAISIEQKAASHNPRSTVGTVTEIYDYLRLLMARAGEPRCPEHNTVLSAQTVSQMVDQVLALPEGMRVMLLAPVIQNKKGEHLKLLQELQAQGFIRARIDGEVVELDQAPLLEKNKAHTIEVIVDRFKVRSSIQQRLADSMETVLGLSQGVAKIAWMDKSDQPEIVFSSKFACTHCGYSVQQLEPRLFSFNSPVGACSSCDGLGLDHFFDPSRIIKHPELSLASGAIRGWDRRNGFYHRLLKSLAKYYDFDIETPFEDIPENIREVILYGSGDEKIPLTFGRGRRKKQPFEGVLSNMQRRYRETDSNIVREELSKYLSTRSCPRCKGTRLCKEARHVFIADTTLPEITAMSIEKSLDFFNKVDFSGQQQQIAAPILNEIRQRLEFLANVGLSYLSLGRTTETLSGGEMQRIRLASQIGTGLVGVMYVLDEPSIGLHQRDNDRLLRALTRLRDLGNTVIVVEHDEDTIRNADHIIDIGPGAGVHGGHVVAEGDVNAILAAKDSLTGQYMSGKLRIDVPEERKSNIKSQQLRIEGAQGNNLKKVTVNIPIGLMTCVTGVSGSGKSTLVNDTLLRKVALTLHSAGEEPAPCKQISGLEYLDKVIAIDQSPIGRTPRSNPATYTGLFTGVRDLFTATQEARSRGYTPGRFSFNVKGGRCEACKGDGVIRVEMHFLADVYVACDICEGKRYNRETLEVTFKGKNIHEVLEMTVDEGLDFFSEVPLLAKKLETLKEVGLSYIKLGQNATTLSGGEAQRIKLAKELSKRDTGRTLYILDEPTTGLHFHDVKQLLSVLAELRDRGNTIVIIEHNLDVIKTSDWVIDLGPEGGEQGGEIVVTGTPETVASHASSYTGHFLKKILTDA